jgi:predicted GIY-YIG superfamily endonuclease
VKDQPGTVYLIHFARPYWHARHYIGFSTSLEDRLDTHEDGGSKSARLMQVIEAAGIEWEVVMIWPNKTRAFERALKRRHGAGRFCPECKRLRECGAATARQSEGGLSV